jgi:hypothetical protein
MFLSILSIFHTLLIINLLDDEIILPIMAQASPQCKAILDVYKTELAVPALLLPQCIFHSVQQLLLTCVQLLLSVVYGNNIDVRVKPDLNSKITHGLLSDHR